MGFGAAADLANLVGLLFVVGGSLVAFGRQNERVDSTVERTEKLEEEAIKKDSFVFFEKALMLRLDRIERKLDNINTGSK